ncbi:MAG: hypothetical protein IPO21_00200 [Bacteroidales bacterium]|nr:hypothetical protein [Bacteroidales bacterium]
MKIIFIVFFYILFLPFFSFTQTVQCDDLNLIGGKAYNRGVLFTGRCLTLYENGNKKSACDYFQGLKEGKEETFYESGSLKSTSLFCEGQMHGDCCYNFYLEDGQLRSTISFEYGERIDIIQFHPYYLFPVVVGEINGTIKRSLLQNKSSIEVKLLKTYFKYFDDKGKFDSKYSLKITDNMDFAGAGDINFVTFRMTCELPISEERNSIYDHLKFNGKANAPSMSPTMLENFTNTLLTKFSLTELVLYRRDGVKNYMWILPGREVLVID